MMHENSWFLWEVFIKIFTIKDIPVMFLCPCCSDYRARFKHPRRAPLSVRHSKALKQGLFRLENLPTLLLTHAATFLMGAAV